MNKVTFLEKLISLPEHLKREIEAEIDKLINDDKLQKTNNNRPVFGSGKGWFTISPDFDEPLEDFNDYM